MDRFSACNRGYARASHVKNLALTIHPSYDILVCQVGQ
jgi:hypothetical protein